MSQQKPTDDWQAPVELDLAQLEPKPESSFQNAEQFAPEEVKSLALSDEEELSTASETTTKKRRPGLLAYSVGLLLTLVVSSEIYRLVDWGFSLHPALGWGFAAVVGVALVSIVGWVFKGIKGLRQLDKVAELRTRAEQLASQKSHGEVARWSQDVERFYRSKNPLAASIAELDSAYDDAEMMSYLSLQGLSEQDRQARRCLRKHSIETGVMIGASPFTSLDMLLVGWRNYRMMAQLADIYGIAPGAATQWRLLKQVVNNIALAGISEVTIEAGSSLLGASVGATVTGRAGQGVGAALMTARAGSQAMRLCRPLPLPAPESSRLQEIARGVIEHLGGVKPSS